MSTLAGNGVAALQNGALLASSFRGPSGFLYDAPSGALYVGDWGNNVVRLIVAATVSTFAGTGTAGFSNGPALSATFNGPSALEVYPNGMFVADFGNHAIRLISNGVVSTLAGTGSAGFADAIGTNAAFNLPLGLAVKGTALYVADLLRGSRASSVTMVVLAHPPEKPHF